MPRRRERFTNRDKLRKPREALKALPLPSARHCIGTGIGPGDSYIGLWRTVNHYRGKIAGYQAQLKGADLTPSKRHELEKLERYYTELTVRGAKRGAVRAIGPWRG
jgi:hypothetical protein